MRLEITQGVKGVMGDWKWVGKILEEQLADTRNEEDVGKFSRMSFPLCGRRVRATSRGEAVRESPWHAPDATLCTSLPPPAAAPAHLPQVKSFPGALLPPELIQVNSLQVPLLL